MLRLQPTLLKILLQNCGRSSENVNGKCTGIRSSSTTTGRGIHQPSTKAADTSSSNDNAAATTDQRQHAGERGIKIAPESGKLRARLPLVKNFFVGVVDREMLGYPEVVPREDMQDLKNQCLPVKNFFEADVNNCLIDRTRQVPTNVLEGVRQLELYGINAPVEFNGKGWGLTASLIAMEEEAQCTNVALGLLSHRTIIDVLNEIGSSEQKEKYLPKLANGSLVGVEAIYEYDVSDVDLFNTKAEYYPETEKWVLTGKKSYTITGPFATTDTSTPLFLVIAQTQRPNMRGDAARGTTVFLVDGSLDGVKLGDQHLTIGCKGLQMRRVEFDQVHLPASCIVGAVHEGNLVGEILFRNSRLRISLLGLSMAKKLVNDLTAYAIDNRQCNVWLKDMEMVQMHLAKATTVTYAMESMIYMTAGILDEFASPDVALEAAVTKYYTLTQLFKMASKCMDIIGPKSLLSGQETEVLFRDAAQLYTQNESMDTLRLYCAFTGIQHAGPVLYDVVKKQRNPMFHPGHLIKTMLQNSNIDNPKTKMRLNEHLHPSLEPAAQCIEHSVARLQMCVELILTRYGTDVVDKHHEMKRIAEIASTIYAMFASTSRASRSYCIGLPSSDYELLLASTVCTHGLSKIRILATEIFNGQYVNNDGNLRRLSKQIFTKKGYFPVHALTYNY